MNITFQDKNNDIHTFLHIPKNAGKSIVAYIMQFSKGFCILHENSHATLEELKSINVDLGNTFAVCRNPYSRAVSLYKYIFEDDIEKILEPTRKYYNEIPDLSWHQKHRERYPNISFKEFVKKLPWMPMAIEQYKFLPVDNLLRFENLEIDFKALQDVLGTTVPLFKINNTNDNDWRDYYDEEGCEIIYRTYKKDFELLGYSKDINNSSI